MVEKNGNEFYFLLWNYEKWYIMVANLLIFHKNWKNLFFSKFFGLKIDSKIYNKK
jgi:hypothetical protein